MSTEILLYTLFYILVAAGVIYPPVEFISAGFTIPDLFSKYLGSENEQFVQYHLRRSVLTLIVHSLLPFGYLVFLVLFFDDEYEQGVLWTDSYVQQLLISAAFILPGIVVYRTYNWYKDNWRNHPICANILKFSNAHTNWMAVASNINNEFRRIDKIYIQTNPVIKVVATDNWILKITPYNLLCAHQSDAVLIVVSSDTHNISVATRGETQYINIEVKTVRPNVPSFYIRLNALDFKDLQDKWLRPITILPNVTFHRTLLERFIDAFKEQISQNATYVTNQELELCIGCMQATANIKLQKLCTDAYANVEGPFPTCTNCFCRPMWCVECIARWFASKQNEAVPDTWLASKCTCPMCRSMFCIYDVSMIENT